MATEDNKLQPLIHLGISMEAGGGMLTLEAQGDGRQKCFEREYFTLSCYVDKNWRMFTRHKC